MKLLKVAGATSEIWQVFVRDSSSTTGAGLTGLVFNSPSLTAYYHRDTDTTATAISLVTMTVGTYTSGGFREIDSTNMPGWYQFCPPNAALAAGSKSVGFLLKGATNMAAMPIEAQLTAVDVDSATAFVTSVNISAAAVQAIWDALTSALTTVGSIGKRLADNIDATISSRLASASYTAPPTVGAIADAVWDETLAGHTTAGSTGAALDAAGNATNFPAGAIEYTYTVTSTATLDPIDGVDVWFSTDNPATNIVWRGTTDTFGVARDVLGNKPMLDAGTYYVWCQLATYIFDNPETEIVS